MTEIISIRKADVFLDGKLVLAGINWRVRRGEHWFILGPNGSGKTTLTRLLLGYVWPRFGAAVKVLGHTYGQCDLFAVRKNIAWVSPFLQGWTGARWPVLEVVVSGLFGTVGLYERYSLAQKEKALRLLAKLNCLPLATRPFSHISSGEQMKVLIARALITNPRLLILDEACVHLDIKSREFFLTTLAALAAGYQAPSIIFVTQRIEDLIPAFQHGLLLKKGRIIARGPQADVLTEENLTSAFEFPLKLFPAEHGRFLAFPA